MEKSDLSNISQNDSFKKYKKECEKNRELQIRLSQALDENKELRKKIDELLDKMNGLIQNVMELQAQLNLMTNQKFGRKSEKRSRTKKKDEDNKDDHPSDPDSPSSGKAPKTSVKRKKPSKPRKQKESMEELIQKYGFSVEEIYHELSEDELECPVCGTLMQPIGKKFIRWEIEYVPGKMKIRKHYSCSYGCVACKQESKFGNTPFEALNLTPITAPAGAPLLPGKWASSSLMAFLIVLKAQYQIPVNRLHTIFHDLGGFSPAVSTLTSWVIEASHTYLKPLYLRLKELLLKKDQLCADETTLQVINESVARRKRKSYLWQYRTVDDDPHAIVLFEYCKGRSGKFAARFLSGFSGTLLVDGFYGYKKVKGATLAHCWVHARRYFLEAAISTRNKDVRSHTDLALEYFDQIFDVEHQIKEMENPTLIQIMDRRLKDTQPVVDKLYEWVHSLDISSVPGEKLRKAFNYLLNQEKGLRVFLGDPMIPATNNGAEQDFVSVARGRNNWLFAYSEEGAEALALMFSIVKTARRNGLNAMRYLTHIFNSLKKWKNHSIPEEVINKLLPWNTEIQMQCQLVQ